jgi:hypothetical protein
MYELLVPECWFKVREERGDRVVVVTHVFRSPSSEDWLEYFKGMSQLGLSKGRDVVELSAAGQEKDEELWDKLILRVSGYAVSGKDLMGFEDWKARIPLSHKLNAVSGFLYFNRTDVGENPVEETVLDLGESSRTMSFDVLQFGKACTVVFTFSPPEASDYIKYSRASARMQVVRTKQKGVSKLLVPFNAPLMIDLFDKLIASVDGYSFEGKPLMDLPDWKTKIDIYHKREAVRELFGLSMQEEEA